VGRDVYQISQTLIDTTENIPENSGSRERLLNLGGHTDVGQQHEFLDQTVCLSLLFLLDIDWLGAFRRVEMDLEFGRREG
jgi:hypothetical protein